MSSHVTLALHLPEETIRSDVTSVLQPFPLGQLENPITDYFSVTASLVKKIIDTKYSDDAELLGLLVLGVLSSAEFYFRRVLSEVASICPVCIEHGEAINIPVGSVAFYSTSVLASTFAAFEHQSLADAKTITQEIRRFTGFSFADNSSVKKALDDFESLCELRHCLIHARGFAGLKAARSLGGKRQLHKVLIRQQDGLSLIKLAHNAVRAVNHFLSNELVNRWIDRDILRGRWKNDKRAFTRYWNLFSKAGEDSYGGSPQAAYVNVRQIITKRRRGMAVRV